MVVEVRQIWSLKQQLIKAFEKLYSFLLSLYHPMNSSRKAGKISHVNSRPDNFILLFLICNLGFIHNNNFHYFPFRPWTWTNPFNNHQTWARSCLYHIKKGSGWKKYNLGKLLKVGHGPKNKNMLSCIVPNCQDLILWF